MRGWVYLRQGPDDMEKCAFLILSGLEISALCRSVCRESLYWLRYRGSKANTVLNIKLNQFKFDFLPTGRAKGNDRDLVLCSNLSWDIGFYLTLSCFSQILRANSRTVLQIGYDRSLLDPFPFSQPSPCHPIPHSLHTDDSLNDWRGAEKEKSVIWNLRFSLRWL
jgi:hypothetical protein